MNLTQRELAVMRILWEANEPLTVTEIVQLEKSSTVDSVQRVVKNLLQKNAVTVDGYEQVGKKISRKMKPLVTAESIEGPALKKLFGSLVSRNISASNLVAALLPTDNKQTTIEELNRLEELIQRRRRELELEDNQSGE